MFLLHATQRIDRQGCLRLSRGASPAPIDVQNQILGRTSAEQLAQQDRREGVDCGALRTCS